MYRQFNPQLITTVLSLTILVTSLNAEYVLTDRNSLKHNVLVKRAGLRMCEASPRDCPGGFKKRSQVPNREDAEEETQRFDAEKLFRFLLYNLREEERRRLVNPSPLEMLGLSSNGLSSSVRRRR